MVVSCAVREEDDGILVARLSGTLDGHDVAGLHRSLLKSSPNSHRR
jgi:hypothetical protein